MISFVKKNAHVGHIAAFCRLQLSFRFADASHVLIPQLGSYKALNKVLTTEKKIPSLGLKCFFMEASSVKIAAYADTSFAFNEDITSQLQIFTNLMDKVNTANILHYFSVKVKRVTRSVIADELFAAMIGLDHESTIRVTRDKLFDRTVPMASYNDSKSL